MSARDMSPVPLRIVQQVQEWVRREKANAEKYENQELLDSSSVYNLHTLAREVYAAGWADGFDVGMTIRQGGH